MKIILKPKVDLQKRCAELERQNAELLQRNKGFKKQNEHLLLQNRELGFGISYLRDILNEVTDKNYILKQNNELLSLKIQELGTVAKNRVEVTQDKKTGYNYVKIKNDYNADNNWLQARNALLETKRATLIEKIEHLKAQKSDIEVLNHDLQRKMAEFESKIAQLVKRDEALEKENTNFRTKNAELELVKADVEARYAQLEDQLREITKQNSVLEEQNLHLSGTNDQVGDETQAEQDEQNHNVQRLGGTEVDDLKNMEDKLNCCKELLADIQDKISVSLESNDLSRQKIIDLEWRVKNSEPFHIMNIYEDSCTEEDSELAQKFRRSLEKFEKLEIDNEWKAKKGLWVQRTRARPVDGRQ